MIDVVYVVRQFSADNKCLCVYGVFKSEEAANEDLLANHESLEFNDCLWRWEDKIDGFFYRVDGYKLK